MKRNKLTQLFFILGIGLIDALWLTFVHLKPGSSICSGKSWFNCSEVTFSAYSQWFGVPVAVYAVAFYVYALFVLRQLQKLRAEQDRRDFSAHLLLLGALSLSSSIVMAFISAFVLRAFCLFCSLLYLVSIFYFVWAYKLYHSVKTETEHWFIVGLKALQAKRLIILLAGLVIAIFSVAFLLPNIEGRIGDTVYEIEKNELRAWGSPRAEVTLTKYSDFECPACRIAGKVLKDIVNSSGGTVKLEYKFYPLDASCNASIPKGRGHQMACQAAYFSYCAGTQDQFWGFHDYIFENQHQLSESLFWKISDAIGLDQDKMRACVASNVVKKAIESDISEGDKLKLPGTPAIFINGKRFEGKLSEEALREAIAQTLTDD